jgi:hypothetical protein
VNAQIKVDIFGQKNDIEPTGRRGREGRNRKKRNEIKNCRLTGEARHANTYLPTKK